MKILLLNPNTTESVTELMLAAGREAAGPGTRLIPATAPRGVPYIATRAEAQIGGAVALEMLAERHHEVDAAIIAAFGDPGLFGARELFDIPVVGMAEAAMLTACMLGRRFAIVTFTRALGPWFRECVEMHRLQERCAGVRMLEEAFGSISQVQEEKEALLVDLANRAVLASAVTFLVTVDLLPARLSVAIREFTSDPLMFNLLVAAMLFVVGMFLESNAAYIMLVPLFHPIALAYGLDPLHFGFLFVYNLVLGMLTPPVGVVLFVVCGIANITMGQIMRHLWPFVAFGFGLLLLFIVYPPLVIGLPRALGY